LPFRRNSFHQQERRRHDRWRRLVVTAAQTPRAILAADHLVSGLCVVRAQAVTAAPGPAAGLPAIVIPDSGKRIAKREKVATAVSIMKPVRELALGAQVSLKQAVGAASAMKPV
jgi:hypothetical protein